MIGILLDTSAYSALGKNHPKVCRSIGEAQHIFFNAVAFGEILAGFRKGTLYDANKEKLDEFIEKENVKILALDEDTASCYALICDALRRNGTPIALNDIWIASTAMQHGLRVLTLDQDYLKVPQIRTECFKPDA
jgi:tRNA(fMet)-specific endonuclease VapC